jgi:hypothetical protein
VVSVTSDLLPGQPDRLAALVAAIRIERIK